MSITMNQTTAEIVAEIGAVRYLLERLYVLQCAAAADPVAAAALLRAAFSGVITQPCRVQPLDPAWSDTIASLTDDAVDRSLARIEAGAREFAEAGRAGIP